MLSPIPRAGLLLAPGLLMALTACSGGHGRFPSLAERPAERQYAQSGLFQPTPPTIAQPTPATSPRVTVLRDAAQTAAQRFIAQQDEATRLVTAARGETPGSDAWSRATIALGGLTNARAEVLESLSELDSLLVAATIQGAGIETPDITATRTADHAVAAIVADEDKLIMHLNAELAG